MRSRILPLAVLVLAVAPVVSAARPATASAGIARAWATVNVCDTDERPDTIGIRGWMPGLRRKSTMLMRFRVQYRDRMGRWRTMRGARADSGWVRLGSKAGGEMDAGWSFRIEPPSRGASFELRGKVIFWWRRGGETLRRRRAITEAGHAGTQGSDPPGYSAASCTIRG
jgi:hypothetical protein